MILVPSVSKTNWDFRRGMISIKMLRFPRKLGNIEFLFLCGGIGGWFLGCVSLRFRGNSSQWTSQDSPTDWNCRKKVGKSSAKSEKSFYKWKSFFGESAWNKLQSNPEMDNRPTQKLPKAWGIKLPPKKLGGGISALPYRWFLHVNHEF